MQTRRAIVQQRVERMKIALANVFGVPVPEPIDVAMSDWENDPFSLGSYLAVPPGVSAKRIAALASPVGERLGFAGEAMSLHFSGYIHGAMLTGIREAERLLGASPVALSSGLTFSAADAEAYLE